ncbi:Histone deacetylase domain [Trinorchestia longiramus]|nr:Histone deacetylase domain [Trinorchestia longiramus]
MDVFSAQDLIRKKQRDAAAAAAQGPSGNGSSLSTYPRNCHPYRPSPGPHHDDFPLRKTASEPNICLKVRLKQRVFERRSSPLTRRKDKPGAIKRRLPHSGEVLVTLRWGACQTQERCLSHSGLDSCSTPDSGQSSPPNGIPTSRSSSGSTPINEEGSGAPGSVPYNTLDGGSTAPQGSCSDLTLYSSPSLPNISLGRPPHTSQQEGMKLSMVSEADGRGEEEEGATAPLCRELSMTGHVLPSTLPYYPSLPVSILDETCYPSSARLAMVMAGMDPGAAHLLQGPPHAPYPPPSAVSMAEVQGRLNRSIQRPLGRTQSAPLPLGHPMLQGGNPPSFLPPNLQFDPNVPLEHNLVKQHVRKTVLTRSSSKSHVENVEEETEAAVAQAIGPDARSHLPSQHVMDLTGGGVRPQVSPDSRYTRAPLSHREIIAARLTGTGSSSNIPRSGTHIARPLSRAQSSPLVTLNAVAVQEPQLLSNKKGATTGFAYDSLMQKHQCICGDNSQHPEHGGRLQAVYERLQDTGLSHACHRLHARKATLEEIRSCHSEAHTLLFGTNPLNRPSLDISKLAELPFKSFVRLQCGGIGVDSDTTWNELHTASAAKMAAGCVIELAFKVATGELRNGFALVRPPGHHAEQQTAMGFCFFNSIAIAARQLQLKLNLDKILILDWDVHHGNGTQSMFYDDPHVLYMSLHRYDEGSFFPGTGAPQEVGENDGYGFNVNIAWSGSLNPPLGDAEYMAAFRTIVMPIAKDFNPDIVLVSAGFDAAAGHPGPLGGYKLSPSCFAYMTSQLMTLARGKVVLALEGGYHIPSVCDGVEACVRALLGEPLPPLPARHTQPCQPARDTLHTVIAIQSSHWPVVRRQAGLVNMTATEAEGRQEEQDTVSAMASLRVNSCAAMAAVVAAEGVLSNATRQMVVPIPSALPPRLTPSSSPLPPTPERSRRITITLWGSRLDDVESGSRLDRGGSGSDDGGLGSNRGVARLEQRGSDRGG